MLAEDAFTLGAEPLDGHLGLKVPVISLELNPVGAQFVEGVAQEQVLRFGIDAVCCEDLPSQVAPISSPPSLSR